MTKECPNDLRPNERLIRTSCLVLPSSVPPADLPAFVLRHSQHSTHAFRRPYSLPRHLRWLYQQSLRSWRSGRRLVDVRLWNIRDYTADSAGGTIRPFGGGPGMLISCQPVFDCVAAVQADSPPPGRLVMLTPQGRLLDHQVVTELAGYERLLLLCGRLKASTKADPDWPRSAGSFCRRFRHERRRSDGHACDRHGHPQHSGGFGRCELQHVRIVCRSLDAGSPSIHAAAGVSWHGGAARSLDRQPRTDFAVAGRAKPSSD